MAIQLVRCMAYILAFFVVSNIGYQVFIIQTQRQANRGVSKVDDVGDVDLGSKEISGPNSVSCHRLHVVYQVSISLYRDRISRATEINDWERTFSCPSSTRPTTFDQRSVNPRRTDMPLKNAVNLDCGSATYGDGKFAIHNYIAPEASRSTAVEIN